DPEWRAQFSVTRSVLEEVDAANIPSLVVFNKIDKVDAAARAELLAEHADALCVSAHAPDDAVRTRKALEAFFEADYEEATLEIPFAQGHLLGEIHARARVLS